MLSQENVEVPCSGNWLERGAVYEKETGLLLCILISAGAYVARACKGEALSRYMHWTYVYMVRQRSVGQRKANIKHAQDVFPNSCLILYLNESSANIYLVNGFPEITRVFFDSPIDS